MVHLSLLSRTEVGKALLGSGLLYASLQPTLLAVVSEHPPLVPRVRGQVPILSHLVPWESKSDFVCVNYAWSLTSKEAAAFSFLLYPVSFRYKEKDGTARHSWLFPKVQLWTRSLTSSLQVEAQSHQTQWKALLTVISLGISLSTSWKREKQGEDSVFPLLLFSASNMGLKMTMCFFQRY